MAKAVSLFSGCGGSDKGVIDAGFEILLANDILPYAKEVYEANLPPTDYRVCDISEIKSFPKADLLFGCYPCQGFSQGGARDPERHVNYLYREFRRALDLMQPKAFIVENVSGMARADFQYLLNNQLRCFRLAGYKVSWSVLNAADYGVAQERKRIFIAGVKTRIGMRYSFPKPTHGPGMDRPWQTQRDAIADLPGWPTGEFCEDKFHWYYLSRNRYRGWDEPSKTIVGKDRHIPLHPISPRLLRVNTDRWRFEHKGPARRLSYREAARLQGLPFSFPDTVSLPMKYRVVGNAVPPPLFQAVAAAMPDIW